MAELPINPETGEPEEAEAPNEVQPVILSACHVIRI